MKAKVQLIFMGEQRAGTKQTSPLLVLVQSIVCFLGTYLMISSICDMLNLEVSSSVLVCELVASILFVLIMSLPKKQGAALIVGLLAIGIQFVWNYKRFSDAFFHIENAWIARFNKRFDTELYYYVVKYSEKEACTQFFCIAAELLALIIAIAIVWNKGVGIWYCFLTCIVMLAAVVESWPSPILLLSLSLYSLWLYVAKQGIRLDNRRHLGYYGLSLLVLVLVLAVSAIIMNEPLYDEWTKDSQLREQVQQMRDSDKLVKAVRNLGESVDKWLSEKDDGEVSTGETKVGMAGGDLVNGGELKFSGETALRVTLARDSGTTYLRGFAGANYTGKEWVPITEAQYANYIEKVLYSRQNPVDYTARLIQQFMKAGADEQYNGGVREYAFAEKNAIMSIELVKANHKYYYSPYDTLISESTMVALEEENVDSFLHGDDEYESTKHPTYYVSYFYNKGNHPFTTSFTDDLSYSLQNLLTENWEEDNRLVTPYYYEFDDATQVKQLSEEEQDYAAFVRETYLGIPYYCRMVKNLLSTTGTVSGDIALVRDYLAKNCSYSINPGSTPKNEDYIEYFLLENKKGFCMHFASAATILFRSLGIPARYVEGYVIKESEIKSAKNAGKATVAILGTDGVTTYTDEDFVEVEVTDRGAHAWVEIYIYGYGWYPVEVTTGFMEETSVYPKENVTQVTPGITAEPTKSEEKKPTVTESLSIKPTPTVSGGDKAGTPSGKGIVTTLLVIAIVLITLVFIIWVRSKLRHKKLCVGRPKKRVLAYYQELLGMLHLIGIYETAKELEAEFIERIYGEETLPLEVRQHIALAYKTAEKAKFSNEVIDKEELNMVAEGVESLWQYLWRYGKKTKRLWLAGNRIYR